MIDLLRISVIHIVPQNSSLLESFLLCLFCLFCLSERIGFHRNLLPIFVQHFSICSNSTVCSVNGTLESRWFLELFLLETELSSRSIFIKPKAMKKLHLQETKHAQNFSSTLCELFISVDNWKCFWWGQIFSKGKKRGFYCCCLIWSKCFQIVPH